MLMKKYYAVYVEVPTGYPGVEELWGPICGTPDDLRSAIQHSRNYALLKLLEAGER